MQSEVLQYIVEQVLAHGPVVGVLALIAWDLRRELRACLKRNGEVMERFVGHLESEH